MSPQIAAYRNGYDAFKKAFSLNQEHLDPICPYTKNCGGFKKAWLSGWNTAKSDYNFIQEIARNKLDIAIYKPYIECKITGL